MSLSGTTVTDLELADELRVLITAKGLDASGGVVNYVASLMSQFPETVQCEHLQVGREPHVRRVARDLLFPLLDNLSLFRRVRELQPHCVHVNPSFNLKAMLRDGMLLTTLRAMGQRRVVVFFHGWDDDFAAKVLRSPWRRRLFRWVFGWPPVIFVLASGFRDTLLELGLDPKQVRVTTTMFDGDIFAGTTRSRGTDDEVRLVFMSRFVAAKGIHEVVNAVSALAHDYPGLRLLLLGDGPERASLEAKVASLGLGDRVEFAGYVRGKEKARALMDGDIFVFPTYYGEGCPVVLLEAMAAGLPVITHGVGGIPDIFTDPRNGILLQHVDDASVAEALRELLDAPQRMATIGVHNREDAWTHYEAAIVSRRMLETYRELL